MSHLWVNDYFVYPLRNTRIDSAISPHLLQFPSTLPSIVLSPRLISLVFVLTILLLDGTHLA